MPESKLVAAIARREVGKIGLSSELSLEAANALEGAAVLRKALTQQVKRLTDALTDANSVLRSAHSVCLRNGDRTNWPALTKQIGDVLAKQQEILNPQDERDRS